MQMDLDFLDGPHRASHNWTAFEIAVIILMLYVCFTITGIYVRIGVFRPLLTTLDETATLQSVQNSLIMDNKKAVYIVMNTQAALLPMVEDANGRIADILFGNGRGGGGAGGANDPGRTLRETNQQRQKEEDRLISRLQRGVEATLSARSQEAKIRYATESSGFVVP